MENKNSKLKGFTLIELIIVLAIFSGLMVLIMSFIDPVSRQMTDTSIRERTSAYVDNISDYLDSSMRYSQFIRIYEKGICDAASNDIKYKDYTPMGIDGYSVLNGRDERWLAARDFVDDYFDGAVRLNGTSVESITGQVHVLEILNGDTMIYDPASKGYTIDGKAGEIYETVYDFTAGDSILVNPTDPVKVRTFTASNCHPSIVSVSSAPVQVINSEHLLNYSYYYQLGTFNLEPIPDSDLGIAGAANPYKEVTINPVDSSISVGSPLPIDANANYYYSRLTPMTMVGIADPTKIEPTRFCLNVVSYQKGNMFLTTPDDGTTIAPVFRSPAAMNSSSMALVNAIAAAKGDTSLRVAHTYYRLKQQDGTGSYLAEDNSVLPPGDTPVIETISIKDAIYAQGFINRTLSAASGNNIYIVYAVPGEIDDGSIT